MPATARLSALDASFRRSRAPPPTCTSGGRRLPAPADGTMPTFDELRDHIASRLCRAPRYRQRLAAVPLSLNAPEWVDAEASTSPTTCSQHRARRRELADMAFSVPLNRQRPLWELW